MGLHRRPRIVATLLVVGIPVLTAGCGSSPAPRADASGLHRAIEQVRAAAEVGDRAKAVNALTALSRLVTIETDARHLSPADATALKTGITRARQRINAEIPAPTAAITTAASPPAAQPNAPPSAVRAKPGRGKHAGGKGKGNGHKR